MSSPETGDRRPAPKVNSESAESSNTCLSALGKVIAYNLGPKSGWDVAALAITSFIKTTDQELTELKRQNSQLAPKKTIDGLTDIVNQ